MKRSLKGYNVIAFKSVLSWLKIGMSGCLLSVICITVSIWLLASNNPPEVSGWNFFRVFALKPWASLSLLSSILYVCFYIMEANKYAIQVLVNEIWTNKAADFVRPKIYDYVVALTDNQPEWLENINASSFTKRCHDFIKRDKTLHIIQRLVLSYGFKRLALKKSDFDDIQHLPGVVIDGIETVIAQKTKPSALLFWVLLITQMILLILAMILT